MYKAVLATEDGSEFVTDFERETIEEVWDEINHMGSRWIFYPVPFVVEMNDLIQGAKGLTVVSCPDGVGLTHLEGQTLERCLAFLNRCS